MLAEAKRCYLEAIRIKPSFSIAWSNLAGIFKEEVSGRKRFAAAARETGPGGGGGSCFCVYNVFFRLSYGAGWTGEGVRIESLFSETCTEYGTNVPESTAKHDAPCSLFS